jgi:hypothetical protein
MAIGFIVPKENGTIEFSYYSNGIYTLRSDNCQGEFRDWQRHRGGMSLVLPPQLNSL